MRVTLRVTVADPPSGGEFGLQEGKGNDNVLLQGRTAAGDSRVYDTVVTVDVDGARPRWSGPAVQGSAAERFVYLGWRPSPGEAWHRRWKLSLESVDPAQLREGAVLAATVRVGGKGVRPTCDWVTA